MKQAKINKRGADNKKKIQWEKTKIIATIGPASSSKEVLREMFIAGVDVCRLNFSHGTHDEHKQVIKYIRELNKELGTHIPILADLQGPKIRIGDVENNGIDLIEKKDIIITTSKCLGTAEKIYITYPQFPRDVKAGERILIDDGKLALDVVSTDKKNNVKARVIYGGKLSSKKGVNLPNTKISLPCLTEKDLKDLRFALDNDIEWIGLSFVRSATDITELRQIIARHTMKNKSKIIAKIEKPEAVNDIDQIIEKTDGIMVARGDLGVEVPLQNVPLIQKMLVKKCLRASKPIIIATQMMESMITNFRPTRAEVNDVANSVMDGADAVMLSGETSAGKFPVKVIETVQKIILHVEMFEDIYHKQMMPPVKNNERYITDFICYDACNLAQQIHAKAIIGMTHTGYSAFRISSQRPKAGVFIFTDNRSLLSTLNLAWGVRGFYYDKFTDMDHIIEDFKNILLKEGYVKKGDLIVNTASSPLKERGKINTIKLSIA